MIWLSLQHHEEMDKQDKDRREEFKKHEMEKEHKRREHLKELDEKARKEEELKFEKLQEKHLNASKNLHHPVSGVCFRPSEVEGNRGWELGSDGGEKFMGGGKRAGERLDTLGGQELREVWKKFATSSNILRKKIKQCKDGWGWER